jgi:hypothetical protein
MPPRRRDSAQLSLPLADPRLVTTLDRLDEARALVTAVLDGTEVRPALTLVQPVQPLLPLSALPAYERPSDTRFVLRRGRVKKDGTVSGARVVRRLTTYLDPKVAEDLEAYAVIVDATMSEVIEQAVVAFMQRAEAAE